MGTPLVYSDAEVLQILLRFRVLGQPASALALSFDTTRSAILGLVRRVEQAAERAGDRIDPARFADHALLALLERVAAGASCDLGAPLGLTRYEALALAHRLQAEAARCEAAGGQMPGHGHGEARPQSGGVAA